MFFFRKPLPYKIHVIFMTMESLCFNTSLTNSSLFFNTSLLVWTKCDLQGHGVMGLKGDFFAAIGRFSLVFNLFTCSECKEDAYTAKLGLNQLCSSTRCSLVGISTEFKSHLKCPFQPPLLLQRRDAWLDNYMGFLPPKFMETCTDLFETLVLKI